LVKELGDPAFQRLRARDGEIASFEPLLKVSVARMGQMEVGEIQTPQVAKLNEVAEIGCDRVLGATNRGSTAFTALIVSASSMPRSAGGRVDFRTDRAL
jgi:hypothetical protein